MIFAVFGPFPLGLWINCSFFSVLSFSCRHASFEVYYIGWHSAFVDDITHIHRNRRSFIYYSSDGKTVLLHRDRGCAKSQVKSHSSLARFFQQNWVKCQGELSRWRHERWHHWRWSSQFDQTSKDSLLMRTSIAFRWSETSRDDIDDNVLFTWIIVYADSRVFLFF